VCFFSPIKHGLLTGKYTEPATFGAGDFRANVDDFTKINVIKKMQENKILLEERFSDHPHPVMRGIIDALLTDASSGCVLLGQRNADQVNAAATLGRTLSDDDTNWVKNLYKS
jgi:aryl-alcohol dehydrogenase-like predicted oxidoreductase